MDIANVLTRLGTLLPVLTMFFQTIIFLTGGFMVYRGMFDFIAAGDPNGRGFSYRYQPSVTSGAFKLIVGMIFLDLASLHFMGTLTRTFTGTFVSSRLMAYDATGMDTSGTLMLNAVVSVGLRMLQLLGLVGVYTALTTAIQRGEGRTDASYWRIGGTLLGGMALWSFHYFANLVFNTLGLPLSTIF